MGKILDGKKVAVYYKEELLKKIKELPRKLNLVIIHSGDPASLSYLKGRKNIAYYLGVNIIEYVINEKCSQEELITCIKKYNEEDNIDGIMVDRPLPNKFDEKTVLSAIDSSKDVDGYTNENLGKLFGGQNCFNACTPAAAIKLLDYYNIDLTGKNAVVIGRSVNVGKPLALMLLNKNASVTMLHSKSKDISKHTKKADIIFLAVGKAQYLKITDVSRKNIVIDIGINFTSEGKLCGDMADECKDYIKAYSPVPGGVGVVTNISLMENLFQSYSNRNKKNGI